MSKPQRSGPERPSPIERLILSTRLPFVTSCALIALLMGLPGRFVAAYLDTLDPGKAFTFAVNNTGFVSFLPGSEPLAFSVVKAVFFNVFLFTAMYAARYYRTRILSAESEVSTLSPAGEEGFHRAFGGVSSPVGTPLLGLVLAVVYVVPRALSPAGTFTLAFALISDSTSALIIGTGFWEYLCGQWGLRKFGMTEITMKPYYEDRMFGLRPLGSLSVSLGIAFFLLAGIALAGSSVAGDPVNMGVLVFLLGIGVAMLYLPLNGIHRKMATQKRVELMTLQNQVGDVLGKGEFEKGDAESQLGGIGRLLKVHVARDEISSIPTWPFDTRAVERLTAVMIAIITVVLARIAQIGLHL